MSLKTVLLKTLTCRNKFILNAAVTIRYYNKYDDYREKRKRHFSYKKMLNAASFGSILIGSAYTDQSDSKKKSNSKISGGLNNDVRFEAGQKKPDLPTFTAEEVSKHDTKSNFWVTYKNGVYDVTKFLNSHPGGEQILNAGGLSIEPFWNVYGMHKTEEVYRLLESFRIGNLHEDDIVDHSDEEMWAREPIRSKELIVKTARPFNAEIPPKHQIEHFYTPNELFFVRQHMPVPELDACEHKVKVIVKGSEIKVTEYSLDELMEKFPEVTLGAALMCAGNRRSEMNKQVKPVKGINWAGGAISNARWGGVYLRDVLLHCGVSASPDDASGKHVILTGADIDATGTNFSTSIPLSMAMDPNAQILLCTRMNGAPLPPDHGHPVRALVPGAPAVRSVKWLESITVSEEESSSHWHQRDYRSFNPSVTWETADFPSAPPVYSLPVTSAFCQPLDGDTVNVIDGHIELKGYAYSGGGSRIVRVDVSWDGGASWSRAVLSVDAAPHRRHHAWALWTLRLAPPRGLHELELWVKATDGNFNTQPEKFDDIWNIRGILSNAYHKIKVKLDWNPK